MKTPKLNFALICDEAFLTAGSQKLNVIGIFSKIFTIKLPAMHPKLAVVANFDCGEEPQKYEAEVQMVKEKEETKILVSAKSNFKTPPNKSEATFQIMVNFQTIPFESHGKYYFKVLLNGLPAAKIPFEILPNK